MSSPKLTAMMSILSERFTERKVPFCLIGALALGFYGLSRYTADIDMMADGDRWPDLSDCLRSSGYSCYHKTDSFAQYESDLNVFGKVDIMLISTDDGKSMIKRSAMVHDDFMGTIPVVQPSDYLILKLMAIANDPSRKAHDESDIAEFLKLYYLNGVNKTFENLDTERIRTYADRFGQGTLIEKYLTVSSNNVGRTFKL